MSPSTIHSDSDVEYLEINQMVHIHPDLAGASVPEHTVWFDDLTAALNLDLIINTTPNPDCIANSKGIAPVFTCDVYGTAGWRAGFQALAAAFDRVELAAEWLVRIDNRAAKLAALLHGNTPPSCALGGVESDGSLGIWRIQPAYAFALDQPGFVEAPFAVGKRGVAEGAIALGARYRRSPGQARRQQAD